MRQWSHWTRGGGGSMVMSARAIDALGQFLQIVGILLSAPGEWIEYWGILLEREAFKRKKDAANIR